MITKKIDDLGFTIAIRIVDLFSNEDQDSDRDLNSGDRARVKTL